MVCQFKKCLKRGWETLVYNSEEHGLVCGGSV